MLLSVFILLLMLLLIRFELLTLLTFERATATDDHLVVSSATRKP